MAGRAVRSGKTRSTEITGKCTACGNFRSGAVAATNRFASGCAQRSCKIAQRTHAGRGRSDTSDLGVKLYFDL